MNIEQLLRGYRAANVFNPWGESCSLQDLYRDAHELRWRRLLAHFNCNAKYLLVGEAPGYQGCRYSGVPFTSERLLVENQVPRINWAHLMEGHTGVTRRERPWSEPSATIVWSTLRAAGIHEQTVMWNAFPWHPHKPGEPLSNRTPTRDEVLNEEASNAPNILETVISQYGSAVIIAVGKVAEEASRSVTHRPVYRIRHPANGGATLFRTQLMELVC